ncbi:MAG: hypothetical protein ABIJ40_04045, partial [Bacteroidota bacterium]
MRTKYILLGLLLFCANSNAQSPHGDKFSIECVNCHSTENWRIDESAINFDHNNTEFPLIGQHTTANCRDCHSVLVFADTKKDCLFCHKDVHENSVGLGCENCHSPKSWVVENIYDIHQASRFPLLGVHNSQNCDQCHTSSSRVNFKTLGIECYDCHSENYNSTLNPNHKNVGLSTNCQECHDLSSGAWNFAQFGHDFFPLQGGHAITNCYDCHNPNTFAGLSANCIECHSLNFENTTNPPHVELNFSTSCESCHGIDPDWQPANYKEHDQIYPLTGAHGTIKSECGKCHSAGYVDTPNLCIDCHKDDYDSVIDPPHLTLNFDQNCEICHTTKAWKPSTFEHDLEYFPIYSGEHKGEWTKCSDCHTVQNNYAVFECINCHEHRKTEVDDEHKGINGYQYNSESCLSCHPNGKGDGAFNHASTNFPLLGVHNTVECQDCHTVPKPQLDCVSCHENAFANSTNPRHSSSGISVRCEDCHEPTAWAPSLFTHTSTGFELLGKHVDLDCSKCHQVSTANAQSECYFCHENAFTNSTNPNHSASGISERCEDCHEPTSWSPSLFTHTSTGFELLGKHVDLDCSKCHQVSTANAQSECYFCHESAFANSTNPNHSSSGISVKCEDCHEPAAWSPSLFTHTSTGFELLGKHVDLDCSKCHQVSTANAQ